MILLHYVAALLRAADRAGDKRGGSMLIGKILIALSLVFAILCFVFVAIAIVQAFTKKAAKKYFLLSVLCLVACAASFFSSAKLSEQAYQNDCDAVRLRHLLYYGHLIEAYKNSVGKYPFEGQGQQACAFVCNNKQKEYCADTNPYPHIQKSPAEFFSELEQGLGYRIDQCFDPQYVPSGRPLFYIYMIDGEQYFFAVHLAKKYPFSKKVAPKYYKCEISNMSDAAYQFYTVEELEKDAAFQKVAGKHVGGYFELREKQHIREYE